jgi:spermidine/putrescine transport system permease protein
MTKYLAPLWLVFFFVIPLLYVFILSCLTKGTYGGIEWVLSFRAFERVMNAQYFEILFRTVVMAVITAFFCTVLGAFCAWFVVSQKPESQSKTLLLFILPFLLNSLIRLYSLQGFVGVNGPVQGLIRYFQAGYNSAGWTHNEMLMYIGLILTYLPFTVLPLTASFEKWDPQYLEAAEDLGAGFWNSVTSIVWPMIRSSCITSFLIVFIPCLGEYLVPEILGGSQKLYWGQLIAEAYLKWRDWPAGSVLGLILIVLILLLFVFEKLKTFRQRRFA